MIKRTLLLAVLSGLAAAFLASCSNSSSSSSSANNGSLITLIGDSPLCNVLTFRTNISGLTLTIQGETSVVNVIANTPASAPSIHVNFASLRDADTILSLNPVPAGTYNMATISLATSQMSVYDPTRTPPINSSFPTVTPVKPTISIQPPLVITKGVVSALKIDFDMLRSIEVDAQGQITGHVTPVLSAAPVTLSPTQGYGELTGLTGFVRSVTTSSTNPLYTGGFLYQLLGGSEAPAVNVNLTSTTQTYGLAALNQLLTGSYAEVDGYLDANANFIGTAVEIESQENLTYKEVAMIGPITSITTDANGTPTQFNLWVQETQPDDELDIPPDTIVEVNLSPSTTYQYSSRSVNFANLPFGAANLALGQQVVVHGQFAKIANLPTTMAASAVYLKLGAVQGSFASLIQAGSDDMTGAFNLSPCCTLLQNAPVQVFTNNQTSFVNLPGLSGLTPHPTLVIRGLSFYEPQSTTVNGISVPAGTLVVLAQQVHQF